MSASQSTPARTLLAWEVGIVLALSLGKSAVFSLLDLADLLTRGSVGSARVTLNGQASENPVIDTLYQLALILFSLVPVALVVFLLARDGEGGGVRGALRLLGLGRSPGEEPGAARAETAGSSGRRRRMLGPVPMSEAALGLVLFAVLGLGTLALYLAGRSAGLTARIVPSALTVSWLHQAILALSAVRHGVLEETIMIGYLFLRGRQMRLDSWTVILASALLRGLYHSYQGFGPILGNITMGILFGWLYSKTGRLFPLVLAHVCLDLTAFLGAGWFAAL